MAYSFMIKLLSLIEFEPAVEAAAFWLLDVLCLVGFSTEDVLAADLREFVDLPVPTAVAEPFLSSYLPTTI